MLAASVPGPALAPLVALMRGRRVALLTGAGCSTESGIPDYRGPDAKPRRPMQYREFVGSAAARVRYWARATVGWPRMKAARPNAAHRAIAAMEAAGVVIGVITQNVDGLHEAAGSRRICALHGRIADVTCLGCGRRSSRATLHDRLQELNPGWAARHQDVAVRPDGDVELDDTDGFVVPGCVSCGGVLKPDVVFFGENVPKERVHRCYAAVESAAASGAALLVLGSSLTVMSGLRFVRHAAKLAMPVVIVNRGTTRGDPLATYRLEVGTTAFLTALAGG